MICKIQMYLVLGFQYFGGFLFAQDTIKFDNRGEFNQYVRYSYSEHNSSLNIEIRSKVDSVFKKYDFTGNEYSCNYQFIFYIESDSCGKISNCEPAISNERIGLLKKFEKEVCNMILLSKTRMLNKVILSDSVYYFKNAIFSFMLDCDLESVDFYRLSENKKIDDYIFVFKNEDEEIIFDGFKIGCYK